MSSLRFSYFYMCVFKCLQRLKKGVGILGSVVKGICKPPNMGARIHTPVLMIEQRVLNG